MAHVRQTQAVNNDENSREEAMKVKTEVKAGECDFGDFAELDLEDLRNGGDGCGGRSSK